MYKISQTIEAITTIKIQTWAPSFESVIARDLQTYVSYGLTTPASEASSNLLALKTVCELTSIISTIFYTLRSQRKGVIMRVPKCQTAF